MRITTWNVNSVRLRLEGLARLVDTVDPDVLCLQEIKVTNDKFPLDEVMALGFSDHFLHGQPGYHGVAMFSKLPMTDKSVHNWCGIDHCRHQMATLQGGIELHNLYIPSGGDVPDPKFNEKFAHKLDFLAELAAWLKASRNEGRRAVLVGDFNIAPLESDVWSHKQLVKVVSHTPVEVDALGVLKASHDWIDAVREIIPPEDKLYSWWSYRARDWSASDRGRRLDHVWVTPALLSALKDASVLREARGWPAPSDHVPVTAELEI